MTRVSLLRLLSARLTELADRPGHAPQRRPPDLLLAWLTEHVDRSVTQFREGCRALGLDERDPLEDLIRAGHAERVDEQVHIVPATLLWIEEAGTSIGRIFGARSEAFRKQLVGRGVRVRVETPSGTAPSVWTVSGTESEVAAKLAGLPVRTGHDRFDEVFAALPNIERALGSLPEFGISVLNTAWLRFVPGGNESAVQGPTRSGSMQPLDSA